jgi:hypothetical protein
MRPQLLFPFVPLLLALTLAFACGGDDSSSGSPSPSASAVASGSPTSSPGGSATPTPTPTIEAPITVAPSRSLPAADHTGIALLSPLSWLFQHVPSGQPATADCGYNATDGIIDCTAVGYGTIAIDPIPTGSDTWNCHALLTPAPEKALFAANCVAGDGHVTYVYAVN